MFIIVVLEKICLLSFYNNSGKEFSLYNAYMENRTAAQKYCAALVIFSLLLVLAIHTELTAGMTWLFNLTPLPLNGNVLLYAFGIKIFCAHTDGKQLHLLVK